ncbi:MAG: alpha/beta family hydrolase [Spirochaetota bacterium]
MKKDIFNLHGVSDHSIKCTYYNSEKSGRLAVFFPGFNYSAEAPFFYYLANSVLFWGIDLLSLDFRYPECLSFLNSNDAYRTNMVRTEGKIVYDYILNRLPYKELLLVGKSLGTDSIIGILDNTLVDINHSFIWATPFQNHLKLANLLMDLQAPSLFLWGTKDPYFSIDTINKIEKNPNITIKLFENAGHSFEAGDNPIDSIEMLKKVIEEVSSFIKRIWTLY